MQRFIPALAVVLLTACSTPARQLPPAGHPASPETAVAALPSTEGILGGTTLTTTAAPAASPVDHSGHGGHEGHGGHHP